MLSLPQCCCCALLLATAARATAPRGSIPPGARNPFFHGGDDPSVVPADPIDHATAGDPLSPPKVGGDVSENQIVDVYQALGATPDASLLVWGFNADAPLWASLTSGRVVFLTSRSDHVEDAKKLFPDDAFEIYQVLYSTSFADFAKYTSSKKLWQSELSLLEQLPQSVAQAHFDVQIVDGPVAYNRPGAPGRYQSLYTASLLAAKSADVFVSECQRPHIREMADLVFGGQALLGLEERIGKQWRMPDSQCHYVVGKHSYTPTTETDQSQLSQK